MEAIRFIDGFEEGLIGAKVGDKVTLNLTFPESYKNTEPGRTGGCVFNVTINKIVEKQDITCDNMTDEYVAYVNAKASLGYDTVDEMKADARNYMESSKESSRNLCNPFCSNGQVRRGMYRKGNSGWTSGCPYGRGNGTV